MALMTARHWRRLIAGTSGWTPSAGSARLAEFEDILNVNDTQVLVRPVFETVEERTRAFRAMTDELRLEEVFPRWQDELYEAKRTFGGQVFFHYNRGTGGLFGLGGYATHLNGFVRNPASGRVQGIWIATRCSSKSYWPGRLDTIVGGGLPTGISAHDNMVKEAEEEAGLDPRWTHSRVVSTGSMTYLLDEDLTLQHNTMFLYDLEMEPHQVPENRDDEVESFAMWTPEEVLSALCKAPERFKPDICLVLLDFLIRHGHVTPDNCPDLEHLSHALRSSSPPFD